MACVLNSSLCMGLNVLVFRSQHFNPALTGCTEGGGSDSRPLKPNIWCDGDEKFDSKGGKALR